MLAPHSISRLREEGGASRVPHDSLELRACPSQDVERTEIDPALDADFYPPEHVVGVPFDPHCVRGTEQRKTIACRPKSLVTVRDARVIGWDAAVDAHGHLYAPGAVESDQQLADSAKTSLGGHQGYVIQREGDAWRALVPRAPALKLRVRRGLFVGAHEPGNYGSFLIRLLPRLLALPETELRPEVVVAPCRLPWVLRALDYAGITAPVVTPHEAAGMRFDTLQMFGEHDNIGAMSPLDQSRLQRFAASVAEDGDSPVPPGTKIFVSRRLVTAWRPDYRPLVNEADVEAQLCKRGFVPLWPEALRFGQQVRAFLEAACIVGPRGSGMLNACFSREGVPVVDLESMTHCVLQHARLYSTTGKRYAFCFGNVHDDEKKHPTRRAWTIPVDSVLETLDLLEST